MFAADGSVRIESGDNEGTSSIRLPSDPGLAHQNNICVMVCTAESLGEYRPPIVVFHFVIECRLFIDTYISSQPILIGYQRVIEL